jgi:hypothetical protein
MSSPGNVEKGDKWKFAVPFAKFSAVALRPGYCLSFAAASCQPLPIKSPSALNALCCQNFALGARLDNYGEVLKQKFRSSS